MNVLDTPRLSLRHLGSADAAFMLELLNEPGFIKNIGDRGVKTLDEARFYIANGPVKSYVKLGFGLNLVVLKETGAAVGICGLIKRDSLDDIDIGFAFLERHCSKGYGSESAAAVMEQGRTVLGFRRIVAVTAPHNRGSIRVLEKVGLRFERMIRMPDEHQDIHLMAWDAP